MRLWLGILTVVLWGLAQTARAADADEKLVILHADDFGVARSFDEASALGLRAGLVSSGSVIVPGPRAEEAAKLGRASPELDLGVHVALNSEWETLRWSGVSGPGGARTLHDLHGYLWKSPLETVLLGWATDVEAEVRAQVRRAYQLGLQPTHLDTHMGTALMRPDFIAAYAQVAREFGLPCFLPRWNAELEETLRSRHLPIEPFKQVYERERLGELAWIDHFVTMTYDLGGRDEAEIRAAYDRVWDELRPGVTYLMVHLSWDDEESRATQGLKEGALNRRNLDLRYLSDPATRERIRASGARLISWRELEAIKTGRGRSSRSP